jgi:hypothetical protein
MRGCHDVSFQLILTSVYREEEGEGEGEEEDDPTSGIEFFVSNYIILLAADKRRFYKQ